MQGDPHGSNSQAGELAQFKHGSGSVKDVLKQYPQTLDPETSEIAAVCPSIPNRSRNLFDADHLVR